MPRPIITKCSKCKVADKHVYTTGKMKGRRASYCQECGKAAGKAHHIKRMIEKHGEGYKYRDFNRNLLCPKCNVGYRKKHKNSISVYCPPCMNAYNNARFNANKEHFRALFRKYYHKKQAKGGE